MNKKLMKSIKDAHKDKHPKKKHKKAPKGDEKKHHHEKKAIKEAMKHKDVLGAGAKKRKHLSGKNKIKTVMEEFKRGTLHSGGGPKVTNPRQAIAIALNSARKSKKK